MPHDLRFPSIDGLRAFESTARLGGFEPAAAALNISASAVGKRINALEDLLGVSLLIRSSNRPFCLTSAGKEYLVQVSEALALLAAMPLHSRSTQRRSRLTITAPPTFARQILVPALPEFTQAHPKLELELLLSTPFLDEFAPPAAVEIRMGADADDQILMRDRITPMASPGLLRGLKPPLSPADLTGLALLRSPLEPWQPWFQVAHLDWPEPEQGTRYVDLGLTLEAAACGQGVVLGRLSLAATLLKTGALLRIFELSVPATRNYGLLCHSDSDAAQAFCEWLRRHCGTLAERLSGAA
ncbi:LysR substrate-binding domain-containing protein [Roseateles oligotrophus]|uniref:LysR family transcriptional regulator n=1 Tax=Roseateles oligotrophus TaxID=1769250 RepID=A0ABT2YA92_9BURK|nr:LysR substrate-binding domain-containing protein [Roseateles oligotrophus]MCV2367226.1 LysR family transcriptional regulator [Roseateles oligotrophus]